MTASAQRILHLARREWLEQRRQPAMLAVIASLFTLVGGLALSALALLEWAASDPGATDALGALLGGDGPAALHLLSGTVVTAYSFLVFSQLLGIAAVLAGHAVLHDRQCGTLTFLLLAPVRRHELVLGKVLGVIGPSVGLYLAISGGGSLIASSMSVARAHGAYLPVNPAWWIAFLGGGPVLAVLVATVCTVISAQARDVRTAQQGVWFLMFFATFACGALLTQALPAGVGTQLGVLVAGLLGVAGAVAVGAAAITRDLGR